MLLLMQISHIMQALQIRGLVMSYAHLCYVSSIAYMMSCTIPKFNIMLEQWRPMTTTDVRINITAMFQL
jgi:hypothetical protein